MAPTRSPTRSPTLRPLCAEDQTDWRGLWRACLACCETERPEKVYAASLARLPGETPHEYRCGVAQVDGHPVGRAHDLFHRHMRSIDDTCYPQDRSVDPEVRGQGVGRAPIEAVDAAAEPRGAASVCRLTRKVNATARRLYDRIGLVTAVVRYRRIAS